MLTFFGTCKVKLETVGDVEAAIHRFIEKVNTEEGTLLWVVYRHEEDPTRILFHEIYRDAEARKVHHSSRELEDFMGVLGPAIEGEVIKGLWQEVASIDR